MPSNTEYLDNLMAVAKAKRPKTSRSLNQLAEFIHENSTRKGFWDNPKGHDRETEYLIKLLMISSEVSEAVEAIHRAKPQEELQEEVIDIIIRALDLSSAMGINVDAVLSKKMEKNSSRPRLHGKKAL